MFRGWAVSDSSIQLLIFLKNTLCILSEHITLSARLNSLGTARAVRTLALTSLVSHRVGRSGLVFLLLCFAPLGCKPVTTNSSSVSLGTFSGDLPTGQISTPGSGTAFSTGNTGSQTSNGGNNSQGENGNNSSGNGCRSGTGDPCGGGGGFDEAAATLEVRATLTWARQQVESNTNLPIEQRYAVSPSLWCPNSGMRQFIENNLANAQLFSQNTGILVVNGPIMVGGVAVDARIRLKRNEDNSIPHLASVVYVAEISLARVQSLSPSERRNVIRSLAFHEMLHYDRTNDDTYNPTLRGFLNQVGERLNDFFLRMTYASRKLAENTLEFPSNIQAQQSDAFYNYHLFSRSMVPNGQGYLVAVNRNPITNTSYGTLENQIQGRRCIVYQLDPNLKVKTSAGSNGIIAYLPSTQCARVLVDSQNRIVIAGFRFFQLTNGIGTRMFVWRLNSSYVFDASFNSDGQFEWDPRNSHRSILYDLTLGPDDELLLSGTNRNHNNPNGVWHTVHAVLNSAGNFRNSFGTNGVRYDRFDTTSTDRVHTSFRRSIITADGKIISLAQTSKRESDYSNGGTLERAEIVVTVRSYATGQFELVKFMEFTRPLAFGNDLIVDKNNRIVIAGTIVDLTANSDHLIPANVVLARLNRDLTPDTSFGPNGTGQRVFEQLYQTSNETDLNEIRNGATTILQAPNGGYWVAGNDEATTGRRAVLLRLKENGSNEGFMLMASDTLATGVATIPFLSRLGSTEMFSLPNGMFGINSGRSVMLLKGDMKLPGEP